MFDTRLQNEGDNGKGKKFNSTDKLQNEEEKMFATSPENKEGDNEKIIQLHRRTKKKKCLTQVPKTKKETTKK